MTTYWVRPARAADLKAVRELARRVRRELHLSMRAAEQATPAPSPELLWVVEAGRSEIVGCCGVREGEAGVWEIDALYLAPEWRGFGLGRALAEQAIRSVQQAGGLRLFCKVPGDLPEAVTLLKRLGFEEDGGSGGFAKTLGRIS